ncbi:unnamed protein product [Mycena citricolor]|uniref:Uncharacterized protein n=1 Tax=Mycena citricolor TaxID=2018698 RepID=A0AAD2HC17_9AGAR|nr:unnamed protein product [Mycena citricolor]CAK5272750.1 unnamed protein product [Mycena citricolor]
MGRKRQHSVRHGLESAVVEAGVQEEECSSRYRDDIPACERWQWVVLVRFMEGVPGRLQRYKYHQGPVFQMYPRTDYTDLRRGENLSLASCSERPTPDYLLRRYHLETLIARPNQLPAPSVCQIQACSV